MNGGIKAYKASQSIPDHKLTLFLDYTDTLFSFQLKNVNGLSGQLWDHVLRPVGVEDKGLPDSKQNRKVMVDPAQA